jgi:hypothetical protein
MALQADQLVGEGMVGHFEVLLREWAQQGLAARQHEGLRRLVCGG